VADRSSKDSTKSRILRAATRLFAEQGYQKTTIVDISREAGFSEAALYEYFEGKEDLLLTIPDVWVNAAIQELKEQLFGIKGAFNKLRKFVWWYLRYIEKDPPTAKIVFLSIKVNRLFIDTAVYANVKTFYGTLLDIFEEGKQSGEMRSDLDPYVARSIVLGTVEHIVIRWLLKDMSYSLFDNIEHGFDILVDGLAARRGNYGSGPEINV
jgi:TetR/AcrR family fatty acid metabolism transcriptional regulator